MLTVDIVNAELEKLKLELSGKLPFEESFHIHSTARCIIGIVSKRLSEKGLLTHGCKIHWDWPETNKQLPAEYRNRLYTLGFTYAPFINTEVDDPDTVKRKAAIGIGNFLNDVEIWPKTQEHNEV